MQKGWAYGPRWQRTRIRVNFSCSYIEVVYIETARSLEEILSRELITETCSAPPHDVFAYRGSILRCESHLRASGDHPPGR